jgi:hypothetical protein
MATHAGDLATARMLWSATYETSQDPNIRQNAIEHLRDIQVDEDVTYLQAAVTRLGRAHGTPSEQHDGTRPGGTFARHSGRSRRQSLLADPKAGFKSRHPRTSLSSPRDCLRDTNLRRSPNFTRSHYEGLVGA